MIGPSTGAYAMSKSVRLCSHALGLLACACALVVALLPVAAFAATSVVCTATVNPSYANPATGVIEDAAADGNVALGESMVQGATHPVALVEQDTAGNAFVTMRFMLQDQISAMSFEVSQDGATYTAVAADITQTNESENSADYRFAVPDVNMVVRIVMDVIPMSRSVVYFATLSDIQEGNADGFVSMVAPGEGEGENAVADAGEDAASSQPSASEPIVQEGEAASEQAPGAAASATDAKPSATEGESLPNTGIQEFNADGREVTSDASTPLDFATIATAIGAIALVGGVACVVVYAAHVRPKRARQAAAMAAASPKVSKASSPTTGE